jgi:hypothetical protein
MANRVRRRQDDHRHARSHHPPLRSPLSSDQWRTMARHRNRQRQLALQASQLIKTPSPGPPFLAVIPVVHRHLPRRPPPALLTARGGLRGPLLWTTGVTAQRPDRGSILRADRGGQFSTPVDNGEGYGTSIRIPGRERARGASPGHMDAHTGRWLAAGSHRRRGP